jgi:hypothetical protein
VVTLNGEGNTGFNPTTGANYIADGLCDIREAVYAAGNGSSAGPGEYGECSSGQPSPTMNNITFAGVYNINFTAPFGSLSSILPINTPMSIDGNGSTLNGIAATAQNWRFFEVTTATEVIFDNFNFNDHHKNTVNSGEGPFIRSTGTEIVIKNSNFTGGIAAESGGAVAFNGENLTINNTNFSSNSSINGGGALYIEGSGTATISITGGTMDGNAATGTGSGYGGAIYSEASFAAMDIDIDGTTFANNTTASSSDEGGVIAAFGGSISPITVDFFNTTIGTGNTSDNCEDFSSPDATFNDNGGNTGGDGTCF